MGSVLVDGCIQGTASRSSKHTYHTPVPVTIASQPDRIAKFNGQSLSGLFNSGLAVKQKLHRRKAACGYRPEGNRSQK
jgi:hypothetical protein